MSRLPQATTGGNIARKQWGAVPAGELYPPGRCYRCGWKGTIDHDVRRTVVRDTMTIALICTDPVACERRVYRRKGGL